MIKKRKRNLQKIEPKKLLEPLTKLKVVEEEEEEEEEEERRGCRAKLNVFDLKENERNWQNVCVCGS